METNFKINYKIVFLLFLVFSSVNVTAQKIIYCYKGSWSKWENAPGKIFRFKDLSGFKLATDGLVDFFAFRINNYTPPSKKEISQHLKTNTWYEYTGVVEYYVNDEKPTADDISRLCELVIPNPRIDKTPNVKRMCAATIKVAPYKKVPECYNIWFDNIGIGIDVAGLRFGK